MNTLKPNLLGYWRHFSEASGIHLVCPYLLAAVCWRETNAGTSPLLDKPGPEGSGDGGHGRGLMQIDDRTHAAFVAKKLPSGSLAWTNPRENIIYGAGVLAAAMATFPDEPALGVAAYNAGAGAIRGAVKTVSGRAARFEVADRRTTKNYASGVLALWREFLPRP